MRANLGDENIIMVGGKKATVSSEGWRGLRGEPSWWKCCCNL